MSDVSDAVRQLYLDRPYPSRPTSSDRIALGDPSADSALLWPEGRPREALNILVAGCGTNQAALIASKNPGCSVVGIDVSDESLARTEARGREFGVQNLKLHKQDLLQVGNLAQQFDVIYCTGVLHHLSDPDAGLRALASVLRDDGAIVLMVYGAARRAGVYLLQDVFRQMGLFPGSDQDIRKVRSIITALPQYHYLNWFLASTSTERDDTDLADTFLHPQDRAYYVSEVFDFVEKSGLSFQGWLDPYWYSVDALKLTNPALASAIEHLPLRGQWSAIDKLTLMMPTHSLVAKKQCTAISIDDANWASLVPSIPRGTANVPGYDFQYNRGNVSFTLKRGESAIFSECQNGMTIAEILSKPQFSNVEDIATIGRDFFGRMVRMGHLRLARKHHAPTSAL